MLKFWVRWEKNKSATKFAWVRSKIGSELVLKNQKTTLPKWHPLQKIWAGEKFLMRFFKAPPLFHQMMRCVLEEENGNLGNWFFSNPLCVFAAHIQNVTHMTTAIIRVQYWCYAAPLHIRTKDKNTRGFLWVSRNSAPILFKNETFWR